MNLSSKLQSLLPKKRWQRLLLEAVLIIAVIAGIQLYQARGLPEGAAPSLAGVRTDGVATSLATSQIVMRSGIPSDGAGDGATLVAFWATWCPVCAAEEGNIVVVAKDHRVISVAMQSGDAAAVTKHLQERGIELPALVDADGRQATNWGVRGVPTHFVVDAAGNVRFRVVGYATTWGLKARLWWAETFPA